MKNILILFTLLTVTYVAKAQRFQGGILGGFNASQVEGDSFKGYNKPGIIAGGFVQTDITPAIIAGMEIKYSQKGSRKRIKPKDPEPEKYIMRLGYIDIPLFIGFRTHEQGAILAGITPGYLIHGKEFNELGEFPEEDRHPFNNFDLQPFLGFQYDILDNVRLDLRFALSVIPIRGHPGEHATNYYWLNNQFNNVISLALYYNINY
ncbi:MAG: PorT family protein [Bacteroidales bacterium]|nr:PorT family protein [Bacteroidales bacterium]